MALVAASASTARIADLLDVHLAEAKRQIVHHARFRRGWADCWVVSLDGTSIGYGATTGDLAERPRDRLFQFFLLAEHRQHARPAFEAIARTSQARSITCQSNDPMLFEMFAGYTDTRETDALLFAGGPPAQHKLAGAVFRRRLEDETAFKHTHEPLGDYVVEFAGEIVGSGGYLTHYNPPYADIYMEVAPHMRRRGIGRFLVQEVMRVCAADGFIPAARTGSDNAASRATLLSAGMVECGRLLRGRLRLPETAP
jgi:GNAT superfamily N-acetyltransferase